MFIARERHEALLYGTLLSSILHVEFPQLAEATEPRIEAAG
ncbi:MAG TPA: hypothetical protein VND68_11485 [Chloroflexia bacterium]|jgi:hypothetical protein|nr:hypothetical protein [Chloroflexia bacterium]